MTTFLLYLLPVFFALLIFGGVLLVLRSKSRRSTDRPRIPYDPMYYRKVADCTIRYVHRSRRDTRDKRGHRETVSTVSQKMCMCEVHIGEEHKTKYRRMTENKRAYARAHDMDYLTLETSPYPELHPAMHKISFLRYLMETTSYEWFVLIDSDTVVTDMNQTFESFLQPDVDLAIHLVDGYPDTTGEDTMYVQGSAYMIRNCPLMKEFLDEVWYSICTETLPFNFDTSRDDWGEQSHVQKVVHRFKYVQRCHYLTGKAFQCLSGGERCANVCIDDHHPLLAHPIKTEEGLDHLYRGRSCTSKSASPTLTPS